MGASGNDFGRRIEQRKLAARVFESLHVGEGYPFNRGMAPDFCRMALIEHLALMG
jgi:hypothetical protein